MALEEEDFQRLERSMGQAAELAVLKGMDEHRRTDHKQLWDRIDGDSPHSIETRLGKAEKSATFAKGIGYTVAFLVSVWEAAGTWLGSKHGG